MKLRVESEMSKTVSNLSFVDPEMSGTAWIIDVIQQMSVSLVGNGGGVSLLSDILGGKDGWMYFGMTGSSPNEQMNLCQRRMWENQFTLKEPQYRRVYLGSWCSEDWMAWQVERKRW